MGTPSDQVASRSLKVYRWSVVADGPAFSKAGTLAAIFALPLSWRTKPSRIQPSTSAPSLVVSIGQGVAVGQCAAMLTRRFCSAPGRASPAAPVEAAEPSPAELVSAGTEEPVPLPQAPSTRQSASTRAVRESDFLFHACSLIFPFHNLPFMKSSISSGSLRIWR